RTGAAVELVKFVVHRIGLSSQTRVKFGNAFLRADGRRESDTPLTTIVRHIDYLINIMGEDHVALGSDFDGITLPDELGDVAGLPRL
ncbi:membrane dipeptidase, partial [Enterobacter kobei]